MRIAVVGCGAVGSYYGAKLARAGREVHFLLRSDFEAVARGGVRVTSPEGDFQARPRCTKAPEEIGVSDLVLIGLKSTANDQFARLLPLLVGKSTSILTLQNGLGNEEALAKLFSPAQILGGLCFVCLNRIEPGVIRHTGYGMVVVGEYQRPATARTRQIVEVLEGAGVKCRITDDLAKAHWEKLVWNIPFNGLGVAGTAGFGTFQNPTPAPIGPRAGSSRCLDTETLLSDPKWEGLVRELMLEIIHAANALGFEIPEVLADRQIERTRTMGAYKASTLLDFEQNRPLELENLFLEPLRRAKSAGAVTTRLERLCEVLRQLDARR